MGSDCCLAGLEKESCNYAPDPEQPRMVLYVDSRAGGDLLVAGESYVSDLERVVARCSCREFENRQGAEL